MSTDWMYSDSPSLQSLQVELHIYLPSQACQLIASQDKDNKAYILMMRAM